MRKTAFDDPKKLGEEIERYFLHCEESTRVQPLRNGDIRLRRERPSVVGLAVWLGCSKDTIYSYLNGEKKVSAQLTEDEQNSISDLLHSARDRIESLTLNDALNGDSDSRIASMVLGNFGYSEKVDSTQSLTVSLEGCGEDITQWSK